MAQPTSCDGPGGSSEVEPLILRRKHNGEEGCQGRKEEGREEAVVSSESFQGVLAEHPLFFARATRAILTGVQPARGVPLLVLLFRDAVPHAHLRDAIAGSYAIHHVHSCRHLAEHRVTRVEVRLR